MLDETVLSQPKRRRTRRDVKSALVPALCSLALLYLTAAALVGILAG